MAGTSEQRTIVLGAIGIWAALFLLGASSLAYALIPGLADHHIQPGIKRDHLIGRHMPAQLVDHFFEYEGAEQIVFDQHLAEIKVLVIPHQAVLHRNVEKFSGAALAGCRGPARRTATARR